MSQTQTRRRFATAMALAGAASVMRVCPALAAEGPPETTAVRLPSPASICTAPQLVAEKLLRAEGFTEIRFVERREVDFAIDFAPRLISAIDAGEPITLLAGVHVGCHEVFGNEGIRGIVDLKGKSVGVRAPGSNEHLLLTLMAADVGLPAKDVDWVIDPSLKTIEQLFAEGKVDAFLAGPPQSQDLRARHLGHVFLNTTVDRPWSQYFCCMLAGNRQYARQYPFATKRVLRAILKANDLCASDPAGVARRLVDGGFTASYDHALQMLNEIPYDKWREYDADDTVRFYALRLREADLIKSSPQKIIAENTDWRFLNEVKRELKA